MRQPNHTISNDNEGLRKKLSDQFDSECELQFYEDQFSTTDNLSSGTLHFPPLFLLLPGWTSAATYGNGMPWSVVMTTRVKKHWSVHESFSSVGCFRSSWGPQCLFWHGAASAAHGTLASTVRAVTPPRRPDYAMPPQSSVIIV
ncbi:hypothetical protein BaRGS_00026065 [Batillaria attramentaria]|uniref:Uncharacterized protein n=1 Tax=Batillaria attramentaria TaxID=370345 RepID=A0ABD0K731_9CAEN